MGPCDFTVGCGDSDCTSYYVNDDQVRLAMLGTGCIPSGKHTKSYGKSPFFMGKLTINGHFQQLFVCLPEGSCFFNRNCFGER